MAIYGYRYTLSRSRQTSKEIHSWAATVMINTVRSHHTNSHASAVASLLIQCIQVRCPVCLRSHSIPYMACAVYTAPHPWLRTCTGGWCQHARIVPKATTIVRWQHMSTDASLRLSGTILMGITHELLLPIEVLESIRTWDVKLPPIKIGVT